ncbi:MAG: M48 family metallopeptidase [Oscillospiraceae bacterium]|nr:M48 family metallopeptidase [Oscillospiraceae bacterium]MBP5239433.1 M48 family metallopeptidase [Oscillospiraceae bacterium]
MEVTVIRSRRKTVAVQVKPDGTVLVRAPRLLPQREIRRFVEDHQGWIEKQLRKQAAARELGKDLEPLSMRELKELSESARRDLTQRSAYWAERVGVTYGRISIRHQKSKWGSCSSKGNLNFNCLLMLAPESVRDYVVVHELCHRKHMNHSPTFWQAVEQVLPDWRSAKAWLKQNGDALMLRNPV